VCEAEVEIWTMTPSHLVEAKAEFALWSTLELFEPSLPRICTLLRPNTTRS